MSSNDIILGIDLGTTTSEAAIYDKKKIKMMHDGNGDEIIISAIGINPKTKKQIVGKKAADQAQGNPKYVIEEVKREMGKKKKLPLGDQKLSPVEASAEILKYIKSYSEEMLGQEINRAVITVPANFNSNQKDATKKAGEAAGFIVERIIAEPTAAALAYCMDNTEPGDYVKLMIYDLGGGTFDVSIGEFRSGDNILDIKASSGDNELGGKDFDRALVDLICDEFQKEHGIDLREDLETNFRVMKEAEVVKKELSFSASTDLNLPFITSKDGKPISYTQTITRKEFESIISEKIDDTAKAIQKALKDAKLKKDDIDLVLMVGGSTRIPYVQKFVERETGLKAKKDIDPDRAVCMGAAIQGSIISGESDAVIMDVSPLSMGTSVSQRLEDGRIMQGFYDEIIPANTPQLKEFSQEYFTLIDNQESVDVKVYEKDNQKESIWADDHKLLAEKKLDGIPPKPAGEESITLTYLYNLNGALDVKAKVNSTDKEIDFNVYTSVATEDGEAASSSKPQLDNWESSSISSDFKSTIKITEKRLKDLDDKDLIDTLGELKQAVINEDKKLASELDDKINDLLFDLSE